MSRVEKAQAIAKALQETANIAKTTRGRPGMPVPAAGMGALQATGAKSAAAKVCLEGMFWGWGKDMDLWVGVRMTITIINDK